VHPDTAMRMTQYHHDELTKGARASRGRRPADERKPHWHVPHWRVTWSRATIAAAGASGRPGRSWVIIISATRGA
jgi:hypothetical protein